jgi:hypothetical protein
LRDLGGVNSAPTWKNATARHKEILRRLHLPEPSRFYDFTPADA